MGGGVQDVGKLPWIYQGLYGSATDDAALDDVGVLLDILDQGGVQHVKGRQDNGEACLVLPEDGRG